MARRPSRLTVDRDARVWDLSGLRVTRITIDPAQIYFLFASGNIAVADELSLIIESEFTIEQAGTAQHLNPGVAESPAPVLSLRLLDTLSLMARSDGSLIVRFKAGAEIHIKKHEKYESWQTWGKGNFAEAKMLCSAHKGPPWVD